MCAILKPLLNNLWRNIVFKAKAYVKVDGMWVQVYPVDTWQSWVLYSAAFLAFCATVGIWLL